MGLIPFHAVAQQRAPDLTGIWAPPSRFVEEGIAAGVPVQMGSVGWAPLSAGPPESRRPPTFEEQKKGAETLIGADIDLFANMARNAFRPPYTEAGAKAAAEQAAASQAAPRNPYTSCLPRNVVGPPNGDFQVMQSADRLLLAGGDGIWRTIYLSGTAPEEPLPSYTGYSSGRWINGALVVVTDHFLGDSANGWPMSDKAKVTETFIPKDGQLEIKIVYEDPVYLKEPVGRYVRLERQPAHRQIVLANCVENVEGALEYQQALTASGNEVQPGKAQ
jgi:hypothetical protein